MSEIEVSEETMRKIASQKVTFRYSVKIHSYCYILVNILLIVINLILSADYLWVLYPIFGWLIGLAIHGMAYFTWSRGVSYGKRAIIIHLTSLGFTLLLLIIINFMMSGTLNWIIYPTMAGGLGLLVHVFLYYLITAGKVSKSKEGISRKERAVEKELEKMRNKIKADRDAK